MAKEKILIIRFSSFGDVTQCLSVADALKNHFVDSEVHWITRSDMAPLLSHHPSIAKIWPYDKKTGFGGLLDICAKLRHEKYTRIYDAHNNLRSRVISFFLRAPLFLRPILLRRSIRRWKRFLLFNFRINLFEMPFSGQRDLLEPLHAWGVPLALPKTPQIFITENELSSARSLVPKEYVALAPSAAYELKRWPIDYWQQLIANFPSTQFVLLGGPQDDFLQKILEKSPKQVINLAGKTDLRQSAAVLALSKALVSNDTGLLHVAEQLGKPAIALMGPAPFGFPSRSSTKIMQLDLPCRPCSKHGQGPCRNSNYQECLRGINPEEVSQALTDLVGK